MATVTGYTAAKMNEIANSTVVGGFVDIHGRLLLTTRGGDELDAGSVVGPKGDPGIGPTGSIAMFAGDVAPPGYLLCLGQAVSRTAYSSLFAVIGTKYGAGDGATTFNLPNFKGRVPVGYDASQTEFDTVGEVGGEKTHLLTASESGLVGHNHTQNSHNHTQNSHTHTFRTDATWPRILGTNVGEQSFVQVTVPNGSYYGVIGVPAGGYAALGASHYSNSSTTATNNATTATNNPVASAPAASAHNNLQPYIVMNYIIKT